MLEISPKPSHLTGLFVLLFRVIFMKNDTTKIAVFVIAIVGYGRILSGVKRMSASVTMTFIFCWTAFILGSLFAFSPEIKRLVFRKDRLELDRYKQQVDKVLVEYDEFKKTIYPLLKITMSEIAFDNYLGVPARPDDMIDFLSRVKKLSPSFTNDESVRKLIKAVEVKTIASFNDQLAFMREHNGLEISSSKYVKIKYPDFSSDDDLDENSVGVDFVGLEESANKFQDFSEKARYKRKIKQLKQFYEENFE